jgi:sarcosine oxidase subunit alpha
MMAALRVAGDELGKQVTLIINGRQVTAYEGETVHVAFLAADIRGMRNSKTGEPRSVFCGMGVCFECLVTIDGVRDQRACMTVVREGMVVETQ